MPDRDKATQTVPDYHTKPVLAARVRADNKSWAQDEAKRRGQGVGDFLDTLLDAERDRTSNAGPKGGKQ